MRRCGDTAFLSGGKSIRRCGSTWFGPKGEYRLCGDVLYGPNGKSWHNVSVSDVDVLIMGDV